MTRTLIFISMKEKILELRREGKSYKEIERILGCSRGTISYHCGNGQKEKTEIRRRNHRSTLNGILKRKKDNFSCANGRRIGAGKRIHLNFSADKFKEKIVSNPTCYLTGRNIDLFRPRTYHCDHIISVSKGGKCSLNNMGLACKDANMAKGDMSLDDFLTLCREVLEHNGYEVNKLEGKLTGVSGCGANAIVP